MPGRSNHDPQIRLHSPRLHRRRALVDGAVHAGVRRAELGEVRQVAAVDSAGEHCRLDHPVPAAGRQARPAGARLSQARARIPLEGPHGGDFQRAGGGADPGGLLFLAAVFESRYRQLVRKRRQPGFDRYAGVVACGARRARARIPAAHAGGRALLDWPDQLSIGRIARSPAARQHRDRIHGRRSAGANHRHELRSSNGCVAGSRDGRDDAATAPRPAVREFGHGLDRRLRHSRRGTDRGQRPRSAPVDRPLSRAVAAQPTGGHRAALLHLVRFPGANTPAA